MLGRFITGKAVIEQENNGSKWYTLHNQLFIDEDDQIYLVPRNCETDGYTYPTGGRTQWDIRPAIGHDFECRFHQELKVKISFYELCKQGYICNRMVDDKGILICRNIPEEYLELRNTTFLKTNAKFRRMMKAAGLNPFITNVMYMGVHLNVGWLSWLLKKWFKDEPKYFDISKIYKENEN